MDSIRAFAMGAANRGKEMMVFDWEKAARLIAERNPDTASAGLRDDWEWTGGEIWASGAPVPANRTYTYLASSWATPEIDLDGDVIACFRMESETPGWGCSTYWPPEALAIVGADLPATNQTPVAGH